jgi:hypothetical protein
MHKKQAKETKRACLDLNTQHSFAPLINLFIPASASFLSHMTSILHFFLNHIIDTHDESVVLRGIAGYSPPLDQDLYIRGFAARGKWQSCM